MVGQAIRLSAAKARASGRLTLSGRHSAKQHKLVCGGFRVYNLIASVVDRVRP